MHIIYGDLSRGTIGYYHERAQLYSLSGERYADVFGVKSTTMTRTAFPTFSVVTWTVVRACVLCG
jgi:hypothetical protein